MNVGEILTALGAIGTAAAAFFAAIQLWMGRKRAQTAFEDSLTAAYRGVMEDLPVEAFMRSGLRREEEVEQHLGVFYRCIDRCNEQVFLRQIGRVSRDTWTQWRSGIASNLRKPGFADAWRYARKHSDDFEELRKLADSGFRDDPRDWQSRRWLRGSRPSDECSGPGGREPRSAES
jgi:hypothetical protein